MRLVLLAQRSWSHQVHVLRFFLILLFKHCAGDVCAQSVTCDAVWRIRRIFYTTAQKVRVSVLILSAYSAVFLYIYIVFVQTFFSLPSENCCLGKTHIQYQFYACSCSGRSLLYSPWYQPTKRHSKLKLPLGDMCLLRFSL